MAPPLANAPCVVSVGAALDAALNHVSPPAVPLAPPVPVDVYTVPPAVIPVTAVLLEYAPPPPPSPPAPLGAGLPPAPAPITSTDTKVPKSLGTVTAPVLVTKTTLVAIL
jgi:hypothetical protein